MKVSVKSNQMIDCLGNHSDEIKTIKLTNVESEISTHFDYIL